MYVPRYSADEEEVENKIKDCTQKDLISVIIPVYNCEDYLDACLSSIAKQTYKNFEAICVNDGSTDQSEKILKKYERKDKRFKVINQKNRGAGAARNKGFEYSSGKYLLFLDSDDIFDCDMLRKMLQKAKVTNSEIVVCRSQRIHEDDTLEEVPWTIRENYLPEKDIFTIYDFNSYAFQMFVGWAWDKLINRNLVIREKLRFQELRSTNDAFFTFIALIKAKSISILNDKLVQHRVRENSLSVTREKDPTCFITAIEQIRAYLVKTNLFDLVEQSFFNWCLSFSLWHLYTISNAKREDIKNKILKTSIKKVLDKDPSYYYSKCEIKIFSHFLLEKPCVSILVPNYNNEKYLRECIESIINQSLFSIEIILLNDGSTDSSIKIMNEYKKRDKRIRVVDKENTGYGNTMNVGLQLARGEYIGIVESDDFVSKDMYDYLYRIAVNNDCEIVKADFYRFKENEDGLYDLEYNQLDKSDTYYSKVINPSENLETFKFIMNTWSGIYKSSYLKSYNILHNETPGASFQDNGFFFQTFINCERAYFVKRPFYMNRRDNENSSVYDQSKVYAFNTEYEFIEKILQSDTKYSKFFGAFWLKKFHNYVFNYQRIAREFRAEFLDRIREEFEIARNNQTLDTSMFSYEEMRTLILLMDNKEKFVQKYDK